MDCENAPMKVVARITLSTKTHSSLIDYHNLIHGSPIPTCVEPGAGGGRVDSYGASVDPDAVTTTLNRFSTRSGRHSEDLEIRRGEPTPFAGRSDRSANWRPSHERDGS